MSSKELSGEIGGEPFIALAGDLNRPGDPYDPDLDPNATNTSPDWAMKVLAHVLGITLDELKEQMKDEDAGD